MRRGFFGFQRRRRSPDLQLGLSGEGFRRGNGGLSVVGLATSSLVVVIRLAIEVTCGVLTDCRGSAECVNQTGSFGRLHLAAHQQRGSLDAFGCVRIGVRAFLALEKSLEECVVR